MGEARNQSLASREKPGAEAAHNKGNEPVRKFVLWKAAL